MKLALGALLEDSDHAWAVVALHAPAGAQKAAPEMPCVRQLGGT